MGGDSPEGSEGWLGYRAVRKSVRHRGPRSPSISVTIFCSPASAKPEDNCLPLGRCSRRLREKFGVENFVDPYVARELHRQELRDKELRDVLNALFGKAGDWRVALCIEARRNDYARGELACAIATGDGTREVDRFLEAFKAIALLKKRGPVKTAKAWALLFVLGCRVHGEPMPTKGEVLRFVQSRLASEDFNSLKEHAARDIFTGPILDALLRGRAGRPRKTRRARRK